MMVEVCGRGGSVWVVVVVVDVLCGDGNDDGGDVWCGIYDDGRGVFVVLM